MTDDHPKKKEILDGGVKSFDTLPTKEVPDGRKEDCEELDVNTTSKMCEYVFSRLYGYDDYDELFSYDDIDKTTFFHCYIPELDKHVDVRLVPTESKLGDLSLLDWMDGSCDVYYLLERRNDTVGIVGFVTYDKLDHNGMVKRKDLEEPLKTHRLQIIEE